MKTVIITIPPLSFKTRLLLALSWCRDVKMCSRILKIGEHRKNSYFVEYLFLCNIPLLCRQNAIVVPIRGKPTAVIFCVYETSLSPPYLVCTAAHVKKINDGKINVPFT